MKLFIMRHGEAEYRPGPDENRRLTSHGRHQASLMTDLCKPEIDSASSVLVSPYMRARETADILLAERELEPGVYDGICPESSVSALADYLQDKRVQSCWLVTHMPFSGRLVDYLVYGDNRQVTGLDTADVVCLQADDWLPGCATLKWHRHWRDGEV